MLFVMLSLLVSAMLLGPATAVDDDWARDMKNKMAMVNAGNCHSKSQDDLNMNIPKDIVYKVTDIQKDYRFKRVSLAVLNRAYFFSYILQKLNKTTEFWNQPNLDYYYLSASTSVASVPGARASGVYFDKNTMYPNFDYSVYFNVTYPLFGTRAVRADFSNNTFHLMNVSASGNYTTWAAKRYTPWYTIYLPDTHGRRREERAFYDVATMELAGPDFETFKPDWKSFAGPLPYLLDSVRYTWPYFDCGRTNKWILTAVAPIIDVLPRYTFYTFLKKFRYCLGHKKKKLVIVPARAFTF
jgi:hypothetical protein